jgi:hypothetical protein
MDQYGIYVNKSLEVLRSEFVPLQIHVNAHTKTCPVGSGSRSVFWVAGDGCKTMVYLPVGWPVVISNQDFTVVKVLGAVKTMELGGRIKYQHEDNDTWYDLGPVLSSGYDSTLDSPFETVRRSYLLDRSQKSDLIISELSNAKKSGELDDLFSMGDEFE